MARTKDLTEFQRYENVCRTKFWQDIFRHEIEYITAQVEEGEEILSVGCGPAIIESTLSSRGYKITGLDVSREALNCAPDNIRTVAARAEEMPFENCSFDAVVYIASLQFIEDYKKAIKRTSSVLRPDGLLILMLLNTESAFVTEKIEDPDSYMNRIKHRDNRKIQHLIGKYFDIETEYRIGVQCERVFDDRNQKSALLYIIKGRKKR